MGLLDDAIREHLELKRRHGADPNEVSDSFVSRANACITSSVSSPASWTTASGLPWSGRAVKTSSSV